MSRARDLLSVLLSAPREAGTPGAAHARRLLAEHFTTLGFRVEEQRFRFHPASLNAFPLFGAGLGWLRHSPGVAISSRGILRGRWRPSPALPR